MTRALRQVTFVAVAALLAPGCSDAAQARTMQQYADALAQGDGRGACHFLAAEASTLEAKCTEHLAWLRANAPWLAGARIQVESSRTDEGDTRVLSEVRASSQAGSGRLLITLSCDDGRRQYPMAPCVGPKASGSYWIFSVSRLP